MELLLLSFVPLLVFVVLDSLSNVRYAVLGAVLAAALELGFSYWGLGEIDSFSILFAALVLVFAGLSYKFNNPVFFKFKPVVGGAVFGAVFLVTSALAEPLMLTVIDRYIDLVPPHQQHKLQNPAVRLVFTRLNFYMGFACLLHAAATAWAALRLNRWWWFAISGPGFFVVVFFTQLLALL
ncbi:MAG: septation protein IspZ [Candidatus Latescibacterota bacterium]|nr:septation protein IspZ [Candidatus Latescibacterota bacterium]